MNNTASEPQHPPQQEEAPQERSNVKVWITLMAASLFGLMLSMPYFGFLLLVFLLWYIPWMFYSFWVLLRRPQENTTARKIMMVAWTLMLLVTTEVNWWRHNKVREYADTVVLPAVRDYIVQNAGRCPPNLESAGILDQQDRLGTSAYFCDGDGVPQLSYIAPYSVFHTFIYDFRHSRWLHASSTASKQEKREMEDAKTRSETGESTNENPAMRPAAR